MEERKCNSCVYSTRDGNCRKWNCEGTKTVSDIRKETLEEVYDRIDAGVCEFCELKDIDNRCYKNCTMEIELIKKWLKEQKNE